MNTLMQCLCCKAYWWSNEDDRCVRCEKKLQAQLAEKLTEEDKELLNLLAQTGESDG